MAEKRSKITPKKRLFAHEYLVDRNATQAAIRAGYSEKTAYSQGGRLLKDVEVAKLIEAADKKVTEKATIDAAWVRQQLAIHAAADIRGLLDDNGNIKPVSEWADDVAATITGMDIIALGDSEGVVSKVKRTDKLKALELLGKHVDIQAFKEQVEHTANDELLEALKRGRKRSGKE